MREREIKREGDSERDKERKRGREKERGRGRNEDFLNVLGVIEGDHRHSNNITCDCLFI